MSEQPDLLRLPFDVQRSGLEGARRWTRWNVEFQRRMIRGFSRSIRAQREAERETMDLLDGVLELSVLAARSSLPGADDELSELSAELGRSVASWGRLRDQARPVFDDTVREGARAYDGFARLSLDFIDAWTDAALAVNDDAAARIARSPASDIEPVEIAIEDDNP